MLRRLGFAFVAAAAGYLVGAILTYFLTMGLSPNTHDRAVEAAMTAAFVGGPVLAMIGFAAGFARHRPRSP